MKTNGEAIVITTLIPNYLLFFLLYAASLSEEFSFEKEVTGWCIGISYSIALISCIIIKWKVHKKDTENNVSERDRCERDFRNGLTASQFCFSIPLFITFVIDLNSYIFYYCFFVFIFLGATINAFFILAKSVKCYFHDLQQWSSYLLNYGTPQTIVLIIYHLITVDDVNSEAKVFESVTRFSLGLLVNSVITLNWTISENNFIVLNDLKKEKEKAEEIESESSDSSDSSDEENDEFSYNQLKCRICLEKYSSERKKRTPIILKECGHTVCYACAKQLWLENKRFIKCPFCKRITYEQKGVKQLGKNYAFIGLMDELKQAEQKKTRCF